jgi:hypothetical protein
MRNCQYLRIAAAAPSSPLLQLRALTLTMRNLPGLDESQPLCVARFAAAEAVLPAQDVDAAARARPHEMATPAETLENSGSAMAQKGDYGK